MRNSVLKSISDETRLKILKKIQEGEVCACKIPDAVKITQPATSQHLRVLAEAGLVKMRKHGKNRLYSITKKGKQILRDIKKW